MNLAGPLNISDQFMDIEQRLTRSMQPVTPRQDYINRLQRRLTVPPRILFEDPRKGWGLVAIFVGLFGGVLLTYLALLLFRRSS